MDDPKPTLDYAAAKPRSRARRWLYRLSVAVLILASLWAAPLAWLYVGWRQEQPVRQMAARVGGMSVVPQSAGPAWLEKIVPVRLGWIRERITFLDLGYSSAADDDLSTLRPLNRLEGLRLSHTPVADAGLAHLRGLTGLRVLYLDLTPMTDAGLVHLKEMTRLQELDLSGTRVTDAGLLHIAGLTGLQEISLAGTRVSDAGLVHLRKLTGLQFLNLKNTRVTDAGTAELHKALPGCRILR